MTDEEIKAKAALANKATGKAVSRLREAHSDEYEQYISEEYAAVGLTRKARLSAEQREAVKEQERKAAAKKKLSDLLAKNPELASDPELLAVVRGQ